MLFKDVTYSMTFLLIVFLESGFIIGAVAMHSANRKVKKQERNFYWFKFFTYYCITHCMVLAVISGKTLFSVIVVIVAVGGAFEMFKATSRAQFSKPVVPISAWGIYLMAGFGTICFAVHCPPAAALYVYLIVCVLDGYSQIVGQLAGKHKLSAAISPNKTIEGSAGGAVFAIVTAIVFRSFVHFDFASALGCGALLACAGIGGDLLASRYKRLCGIKDFSSIVPGQGGVIDRFNSFMAAAPVFMIMQMVT